MASSNSLLTRIATKRDVPAMKYGNGSWARTAADRAHLFAKTFSSKSALSTAVENSFSLLLPKDNRRQDYLPAPRIRNIRRIIEELNDSSALGPDHVPTRFLKYFSVLTAPICILTRIILSVAGFLEASLGSGNLQPWSSF